LRAGRRISLSTKLMGLRRSYFVWVAAVRWGEFVAICVIILDHSPQAATTVAALALMMMISMMLLMIMISKDNFFHFVLFFGPCIFIIEGRTDQRNAQINFSSINLLLLKSLRHVSAT